MKIIYTSTLVNEEDHEKLLRAYGSKMDQIIEKKLEVMLTNLVLEAEKELDSRNELYNAEEAV